MLVKDCIKGYDHIIIRCGGAMVTCDQKGFKQMNLHEYFLNKEVKGFYTFNKKVRLVI